MKSSGNIVQCNLLFLNPAWKHEVVSNDAYYYLARPSVFLTLKIFHTADAELIVQRSVPVSVKLKLGNNTITIPVEEETSRNSEYVCQHTF